MSNFNRTIDELQSKAVFWWPAHLSTLETDASIIPTLLETQDKFLSIITLADSNPFKVLEILKTSDFPANLFLKHLVVLTDFGGEQIQRMNRQFASIFSSNEERFLEFNFKEENYKYIFKKLPISSVLNNKKLHIDGESLLVKTPIDELKEDMIMLLLFGASSLDDGIADTLKKCDVGTLLGRKEELEKYVKQKYILVSRITGGAQANTLGQVAQTHAVDFLKERLGNDYTVTRNGSILIDNHSPIPFDIVIEKNNKFIGIELTFQVTTNSTIERKAGQAQARQQLLHTAGHSIAYIIDGAGNFQRRSAISTICSFSDCTVAYSEDEFDVLAEFAREKLS